MFPIRGKTYGILFSLLIFTNLYSSGAYDHGSATGKGNWQISLTLNPFNRISYGQNYGVLSYGLTDRSDIVSYYSKHRNGSKSIYFGGFYQFTDNKFIDLATAVGLRSIFDGDYPYDLFFPQLLYNFILPKDYTIGGSIVNVLSVKNNNLINQGFALDVALYKPLPSIQKISPKIIQAYFSIGIFKNTDTELIINQLYLQYSLDIKFDFKRVY